MARRLGGSIRHHEGSSRARRCGENGVSYIWRSSEHRLVIADTREKLTCGVGASEMVLATEPQTGETSAREVRKAERRSGE